MGIAVLWTQEKESKKSQETLSCTEQAQEFTKTCLLPDESIPFLHPSSLLNVHLDGNPNTLLVSIKRKSCHQPHYNPTPSTEYKQRDWGLQLSKEGGGCCLQTCPSREPEATVLPSRAALFLRQHQTSHHSPIDTCGRQCILLASHKNTDNSLGQGTALQYTSMGPEQPDWSWQPPRHPKLASTQPRGTLFQSNQWQASVIMVGWSIICFAYDVIGLEDGAAELVRNLKYYGCKS